MVTKEQQEILDQIERDKKQLRNEVQTYLRDKHYINPISELFCLEDDSDWDEWVEEQDDFSGIIYAVATAFFDATGVRGCSKIRPSDELISEFEKDYGEEVTAEAVKFYVAGNHDT